MAEYKDTGSSLAFAWTMLAIILMFCTYVFWYYNKYYVMDSIRWVRWAELQVIDPFVPDNKIVMKGPSGKPITFDEFETIVENTPSGQLNLQFIAILSEITQRPFLIFYSIILVLAALWVMFFGPNTQLRRKYDLNGLIKTQAETFHIIAPLVDFDPTKQPVRPPGAPVPADLPPFSEALAPEEWIAYEGIPTLTQREIDQAAAHKAFAKQLGAPWRGWMYLAPYKQVMLASFCCKAVRKRAESDEFLGQLALCWKAGKFSMDSGLLRRARAVLKNRDISGKTLAICNQHAFENTALIRALALGREEGGVLAPAQFIWLRAHDRTLWYPLNNLGRNAFHMEALGAMAHYKAERLAQRPIVRPKVEGAVESITKYMKSYRARPVPQLDYSRSKRSSIKKVKGSA
jgi:intracellular multiplication protein IcmP